MADWRRGYLLDRRSDAMRARAARSHLGDFEAAAGRVIARLTGELVILQDNNSSDGLVDISIDYPGRPPGFVEVVLDIDSDYSAMVEAVRSHQELPAPTLQRMWSITVSAKARLQILVKKLPDALCALQEAGEMFITVPGEQHLHHHANDLVRELAAAGVVGLASRPMRPGESGTIRIRSVGIGGPVGLDWSGFGISLKRFLADDRQSDVRCKLATTGAAERHVFVGITFSSPWPAYYALSSEHQDLPPAPPELPPEITHLWAWSYPLGRCLAWFPDIGWFDTRTRWATP